jgi:hypothetical protein
MTDSLTLDGVIELIGTPSGTPSKLAACTGVIFKLVAPDAVGGFTSGANLDLGVPQPVTDLVASLLLDGERPFGRRASNRLITLPVLIQVPASLATGTAARQLLAAARESLFTVINQDVWTLQWTRDGAPAPLAFDCFRAQPSVVTYDPMSEQLGQITRVMLTFQALPYGHSVNLQTLNFSSPASTGSPPPPSVNIDTFSTVSSSTQPTWWAKSALSVLGSASAVWDFSITDEDSAAIYTHTLGATVNITGLNTLCFWLGTDAPENYNKWHKGNISIAITLSDNSGHTISLGGLAYIVSSNSFNDPNWQQICFAFPQNQAGFDYTHLNSYSITIFRQIDNDGDIEFDQDVFLNGLQASYATGGVPASVRGTVYDLMGILGSAHSAISVAFQQSPPSPPVLQTLTYITPGPFVYVPSAGVYGLWVQEWAGSGIGGALTAAGHAGGSGGSSWVGKYVPCTPGVSINGYVGAGGSTPGGGFIQRVTKGVLSSTTATSMVATVTNATTGGQTLLVSIAFGLTGGTVSSVTDTQGNTYSKDYAAPYATTGNRCFEVWACRGASPLGTTDTITVQISHGQTNGGAFICNEYVPLGAPDATNYAYNSSSTGSVAPNTTILADDTVAVAGGCVFDDSDVPSVGGSWTATGSDADCTAGNGLDLLDAYYNSPPSGSLTATFTWPETESNVGVILGYPASGTGAIQGQQSWFGADDTTAANPGIGVASNTSSGGLGGAAATLPNWLTGQNAGFEGGIGNWVAGSNQSVADSAVQAHSGSNSLACTATAAATGYIFSALAANYATQMMPVLPGQQVTIAGWWYAGSTGRVIVAGIDWLDAFGNILSTSSSGSSSDVNGSWTNISNVYTAPSISPGVNPVAWARANWQITTPALNEIHYADDMVLIDGATYAGGLGATGTASGGGGGGGSAGSGGAGGAGAVPGGGSAGSGGGAAGGAGGASGGVHPGTGGSAPGAGSGGAFTTGAAAAGGNSPNGQVLVSSMPALQPFKTLIAHLPGAYAAPNLVPLIVAGNGSDPPDGRQYLVPQAAPGVNANFNGTYTVILTNFTFATPASPVTITITITQYEYSGGPSTSVSVTRTFTPNTDISNGIIIIDNVTLPIKALPPDNTAAYYAVSVLSSNSGDRYLDLLFLDTTGQLVLVDVNDGNAYVTYWIDTPSANQDIGLVSGSAFDRSEAVSVLQYAIISGGPLTAEPGNNAFLVYAIEGQPAIQVQYLPRFWVDDPGLV